MNYENHIINYEHNSLTPLRATFKLYSKKNFDDDDDDFNYEYDFCLIFIWSELLWSKIMKYMNM